MNIFDFDKCIYKHDSSIKFYLYCLFNCKFKDRVKLWLTLPVQFFNYFLYLIGALTKIQFKCKYFKFTNYVSNLDETLFKFWQKEKKNIKSFYLEKIHSSHCIISASPEFLLKPIVNILQNENNATIMLIATKIDPKMSRVSSINCYGEEKVKRFREQFPQECVNEVYSDSLSDYPLFDIGKQKFLVDNNSISNLEKPKVSIKTKFKYFIKLLRPKHYIKNLLVFVPLFFSKTMFQSVKPFLACCVAFLAFCLASSFVYVINDIADYKQDRNHYKKRKRPIASNIISKVEAAVVAFVLFSLTLPLIILLAGNSLLIYVSFYSYIIVNLLYSFWLKKYPIVDVFVLAYCYVIRVLFGALVVSVSVSGWLYLTIISASLFMGLGKRKNELQNSAYDVREANKKYTLNFLEKSITIFSVLLISFYSLWVILVAKTDSNSILCYLTIPLVMFIFLKYNLNLDKNKDGDPMHVLLTDKLLIVAVVAFVAVMTIALYI